MTGRVLVAGVGNLLRRDDGFGVAVARRLVSDGDLPPGVDVIETGIGGLSVVQQLMDGYRALIVLDAVERGAAPGTVFVLQPQVPGPEELGVEAWRALFSNLHLAEPSRVFILAKAVGALPERVLLVGCQPHDRETLGETLSDAVEAAVDLAARRVRELIAACAAEG